MNLDTLEIYTLPDIKEEFPEICKLYDSVEKLKRVEITSNYQLAVSDYSKMSFLNHSIKSICKEINSSIILKTVNLIIEGKASLVFNALMGQLGIWAIHEIHNPIFQKQYALIKSFADNIEMQIKDGTFQNGLLLEYINQLLAIAPNENKKEVLGSEVYKAPGNLQQFSYTKRGHQIVRLSTERIR